MRFNRIAEVLTLVMGSSGAAILPLTALAQQPSTQKEAEEVIVTATRLPRTTAEIAATVTVISSEDIDSQIAEDLDDLTRYQPGVTMDTAGRGGNQGFVIRGIGGNRVLTLIDGVRSNDIYNAQPGTAYGKDAYEVDDLKSVEIIRGPASVLYGADALGGAVLLQTRSASDYVSAGGDPYLNARLSYSNRDDQAKAGFTAAVRQDAIGFLARLTRRDFSERELNSGATRNPLDGESLALLLKTTIDIGERQRLDIALDMLQEELDTQLLSDLDDDISSSLGHDEIHRKRISVRHNWQIDSMLANELEAQVYFQTGDGLQHTEQARLSYSFVNPGNPVTWGGTDAYRLTDYEFNQRVAGLALTAQEMLLSGSVEQHLVYGFSHETTDTERPRNRCETEIATGASTCTIYIVPPIPGPPPTPPEVFPNRTFPDTRTTRTGLFVQDEITLGAQGRVTLIPGLRYDNYEMKANAGSLVDISGFGYEVVPIDEDNVSANLGLVVDVTANLSVFAQYAQGFRPPNYDEANQAFVNYFPGFAYALVPNPALKPETSESVEFGLRGRNGNARYEVSIFQNDYKDFIESQLVGFNAGVLLYQDQNVTHAEIEGIEVSGQWRLSDQFELIGSLASSRGNNPEAGVPLDSTDPLTAVVGFRVIDPAASWDIETRLTLVDGKDRVSSPDVVTAKAYEVVDLIGHYRFNDKTSMRMGIYNLVDQDYARWVNIQGLMASSVESIALAQAPGRNVRVSFSVDF